ncbi:hypothetical protein L1049_004441 [Liquidambar formosana]|uniref:Transcription repressor n=1 Tax=Liquidambar formosana TaxID=63359 RepID=A0AAP0RP07_LIQFO
MPKSLQKSLQDYLSKIKKPTPQIQFPPNSLSSSTNWVLSGCKHPKTLSFAVDRNQDQGHDNDDAATLSDIDRFLVENFKSLYGKNDDNEDNDRKTHEEGKGNSGNVLFESPRFIDPPSDLCGSHRFFVTPGMSSSLMEEARTSGATASEDTGSSSTTTTNTFDSRVSMVSNDVKELTLPDDCIAVLTYSPNPYDDFRRSMQEMIEARLHHHAKVDWEFMEELLFCYLNVNEKKSHKYILSAFVDLIIVLRQDSGKTPARSRKVGAAGERRKKR